MAPVSPPETNRSRPYRVAARVRPVRQRAIGRTRAELAELADPARLHELAERAHGTPADAGGREWWARAHEHARCTGAAYGLAPARMAGVLAALSPQCPWAYNVDLAADVLAHWHEHGPTLPGAPLGPSGELPTARALAILAGHEPGDVLGGRKVRAFWHCTRAPDVLGPVCVDRHALSALVGRPLGQASAALADRAGAPAVAGAFYRSAARARGMRPHELQAVVWLQWRAERAPGWARRDHLADLLTGHEPGDSAELF